MAARPMIWWCGQIGQIAADTFQYALMPIKTASQRVIQLYRVDFALPAANMSTLTTPSSVSVSAYPYYDDFYSATPAVKWEAMYLPGGGGDLTFSWTAPPNILIAADYLNIFLDSVGTNVQVVLDFSIFYKSIEVSDIVYLQLLTLAKNDPLDLDRSIII